MKRGLLCLVVLIVNLQAVEPDKLLDELRTEMRALAKQTEGGDNVAATPQHYRIESLFAQLPTGDLLREEILQQALQILEQIRATKFSDKVDELCDSLISGLRDRAAKKQMEVKESFEASLRKSLTAGLNATNPKELDAPLQELARLQKEVAALSYRGDARPMANAEAISAAEQVLTMIQDAMLDTPNPSGARGGDASERLKSAARSYGRSLGDVIPRSELLGKLNAIAARIAPGPQARPLSRQEFEKEVAKIFAGLKTLDDMGSSLTRIDEMIAQQREMNGYNSDSGLIYQLRAYRRAYEDLGAGTATSITLASSSSSGADSQEILKPMKELLVKFALTRILGVSGDLAPKEDESIAAYLHRTLNESLRTSNWQLMASVIDAAQTMNLSSIVSTSDSSALRQFLAGINQERAQQYSGAVCSYLSALKTGSQAIPVEEIGKKLQAIKGQHPQDYGAGMELANASPQSAAFYRSMVGNPPGVPVTRPPGSPITLAIPAAETTAENKKKEVRPPPDPNDKPKRDNSPELVKELEHLKEQFTKAGDLQTAISAESLINALSRATKEATSGIPLEEMTDRQFRHWLSTVTISEVNSPYGNKFTFEGGVLTSIRPGLTVPRSHPSGTVSVGKLLVPFTDTSATITIDQSLKKAKVAYNPGETYQAAITPRK